MGTISPDETFFGQSNAPLSGWRNEHVDRHAVRLVFLDGRVDEWSRTWAVNCWNALVLSTGGSREGAEAHHQPAGLSLGLSRGAWPSRSSTENVSVFFIEANISMCHCAAKHHATQGGRFRATSQRFGVRLGCGLRDVRATGSARAPRRKVRALRNSRECFTTRTLRCHVVCGKLHVPQKRVS